MQVHHPNCTFGHACTVYFSFVQSIIFTLNYSQVWIEVLFEQIQEIQRKWRLIQFRKFLRFQQQRGSRISRPCRAPSMVGIHHNQSCLSWLCQRVYTVAAPYSLCPVITHQGHLTTPLYVYGTKEEKKNSPGNWSVYGREVAHRP